MSDRAKREQAAKVIVLLLANAGAVTGGCQTPSERVLAAVTLAREVDAAEGFDQVLLVMSERKADATAYQHGLRSLAQIATASNFKSTDRDRYERSLEVLTAAAELRVMTAGEVSIDWKSPRSLDSSGKPRTPGLLGVGLKEDSMDGVIFTSMTPGMPARHVLKPGDRAVAINGQDLGRGLEKFRSVFSQFASGETARLEIIRNSGKSNEERQTVWITLAPEATAAP
jgi:C-terminal processing protease CtpA/Prc